MTRLPTYLPAVFTALIVVCAMPVTADSQKRPAPRTKQTTGPKFAEFGKFAIILTERKSKALEVRKNLDRGGDFAALARSHSKDKSRDRGGVLPPFERGNTKLAEIPGLEKKLFSIKKGDTAGPFEAGGAWWIVKCLDKYTVPKESPAGTSEFAQFAVIVVSHEKDAKVVRKELDHGGDFDELVWTYGTKQSREDGVVQPPVERGNSRLREVPGLERKLFNLKVGETTGPFQVGDDWWIVRCLDKYSKRK